MATPPIFVDAGKGGSRKDLAALATAAMTSLKADGNPGISLVVSYGVETSIALSTGWARLSEDAPELPMSENVRYDMCSVSKPLTAAAIIRLLLDRKDVSLDSKIEPLLPVSWVLDSSRADTTFRQLIR